MDSGNSGSISSSGDEEYDSRNHHQTLLPSNFFNQQPTLQFNSLQSFNPSSSQVSLFDLSPTYLHNLSQSQPNITFPISQGISSSSHHINQCLLTTPHQALHDDSNNARTTLSSPPPPPPPPPSSSTATTNNASRNSKKRTRASRRAPTTVLTTDTSNFRAMVQEFTGIPAPPFSGSSYSRRLDLLTSSSSLRSSNNSSHFDNIISPFYPLRPSPQKLHQNLNHPNPLLLSSSSSSSSHNMQVDANSSNYQQLPISDLGLLPYNNHHQQHNFMLSMQNQQPIHAFNPSSSSQQFHPFSIGGFGAKSQSQHGSLSVNSLEDLGVNQRHLDDDDDGGSRRDMLRCLDHHENNSYGGKVVGSSSSGGGGGGGVGSNCKVNNFSGSVSTTLNHDKTMENNNNNNNNNDDNSNNNRGEGAGGAGGGVDSWICSSDRNIL
jgi:hypothetical protein